MIRRNMHGRVDDITPEERSITSWVGWKKHQIKGIVLGTQVLYTAEQNDGFIS